MSPAARDSRARVGVVGAGQLARMTAIAAARLDVAVAVLAESPAEAATGVASETFLGAPSDPDALRRLAEWSDVVTFDHEHVPPDLLSELEAEGVVLRPSPRAKLMAQDKAEQRRELGGVHALPVPDHAVVATRADVEEFAAEFGWPVVLKDARGGYDGHGVTFAGTAEEAEATLARARERGIAVVAERRVEIEREMAVVVARRPSGECAVYPVVETVQRAGVCREIVAPAPVDDALASAAHDLGVAIASEIGASGILAVELFVSDGALMINELALRPHNSGHFSLGGSVCSQFENHLRGVLDWPLGDTSLVAPAVSCVNVLGGADGTDPRVELPRALAVPGAQVELYGKQARPGRKLGHVTVAGPEVASVRERARAAASILTGEPIP